MELMNIETIEETHEKSHQMNSVQIQVVRVPVKHTNLGIRSHAMDMSTMVELTSFSTLGKIQPFLVTITTTAALLVDLHCHLTDKEVCGYLGGYWDINSHNLSITCAFPCRYSGKDKSAAAAVEAEISRAMEWKHVTLVGWYHSHPRSHASPSLRDVDSQLDYEIRMKGPSDNGYTPCVGLICSPYNMDGNCYESNFNVFWSMPPPENRPHEYPRPMLLSYTLSQEQFLAQDTLEEIRRCIEYYKSEGGVDFKSNFNNTTTYLERLRGSLASKLPGRNNRTNNSYWDVIREMICPGSEDTSEFVGQNYVSNVPPVVNLAGSNTAVFLTPVNFKNDGPKSNFLVQPSTSRDNNNKKDNDLIPTFQSGELTVSVKNTPKCDYEFSTSDFNKLPNPMAMDTNKSRTGSSDFPLTDITQQITKFSDLTKLANFSTADLAKLSGFSIPDFSRTPSPSPSTYMRNIANLFGPIGKISPAKDLDGNKSSNDYFNPNPEELNRSGEDFGQMLDMSKKQTDAGSSLNLSKDHCS